MVNVASNERELATTQWKSQIRSAAVRGLRNGYLLSGLSLLFGVLFLTLFIGPEVKGFAHEFLVEARGWWPMCIMALIMLALAAVGFQFSTAHNRRLLDALEFGTPILTQVRFVDLTREESVRFEAWFDQEGNAAFGKTLRSRVWQRSPCNLLPPCGQSTCGLALLDPQTQTPLAVTLGESTFIFDHPACALDEA